MGSQLVGLHLGRGAMDTHCFAFFMQFIALSFLERNAMNKHSCADSAGRFRRLRICYIYTFAGAASRTIQRCEVLLVCCERNCENALQVRDEHIYV